MASSNNNNNNNLSYSSSVPLTTPNTTFVQAHPSTFRSIVQRLTGPTKNLPPPPPPLLSGKPNSVDMGPRIPSFKLHERRQNSNKLEIKLINNNVVHGESTQTSSDRPRSCFVGYGGGDHMVMVSPVSPLDMLTRGSPRTPRSSSSPSEEEEEEEEEERAIAEKGFYLHPSPLISTPRGRFDPPELLPLFPLHSPRSEDSTSSS